MLTIIGCGNFTRGDDGLGPAVARRVRAHVDTLARDDVRVFDAGTDGMSVMFGARGSDTLVIVDAARTGAEPGAIYDVPGDVLARDYVPSLNLHDFRWDHAIAAGRKIFADDFPRNVRVLLVQVQDTAYGLELSPKVSEAAESVIAQLEALVAAYVAPAEAPPPENARFAVRAGSLYIDAATFRTHLGDREAVTLVRRERDLYVIPLLDSTLGGYLCKRRTAKGDRVIHAADFFADNGFSNDDREYAFAALWKADVAAFVVPDLFGARSDG